MTAEGFCCVSPGTTVCPTDPFSPLFAPCSLATGVSSSASYLLDFLAFTNVSTNSVGLGMAVCDGGGGSNAPDYHIGA